MEEVTENMISIFGSMFTTGDIIAIAVAIIALIGIILTNRETKKINTSNENFNEKWNQKNIDATLVASARIEWVQNVRRTTAELIAQYFSIINTIDKEILTEAVLKANEKTELLIL